MTEMVVGVALLGGISMITMRAMQQQAGNSASLNFSAEVNKATNLLMTNLNNASRCNSMFVGVLRDPTPFTEAAFWAGTLNAAYDISELKVATSATEYMSLLKTGTTYPGIGSVSMHLSASTMGSSVTELIVVFRSNSEMNKNGAASVMDKSRGYKIVKIPFVTTMDKTTTNKITSCGPIVSDEDIAAKEQLCGTLGSAATWNSTTKTCTLNSMTCPAGQIPTQMTSLGKLICISTNTASFRDQLFDFSSTTCPAGQGVTLTVGANGKIKAGCTNSSNCPASGTMTWYGTTAERAQCTAAIGTAAPGSNTTINDVTADAASPGTGYATFTCDATKKAWILVGTPTCLNATLDCGAGATKTIYWSGTTKFCQASSGTGASRQQKTITDSTNSGSSDGTGTAVIECVAGQWTIVGTPVCN